MSAPRHYESVLGRPPQVSGAIELFICAIEQVTGISFEVLAERANSEIKACREAAREDVLEYLGESAVVTPEEAEQIRSEWR
jgi:hypothetical protein